MCYSSSQKIKNAEAKNLCAALHLNTISFSSMIHGANFLELNRKLGFPLGIGSSLCTLQDNRSLLEGTFLDPVNNAALNLILLLL